MESHIIQEMLHHLKPVLKDKVKAERLLTRFWQNKIALVWETKDVHRAANELELALTEAEAVQVLQKLHIHYNRQLGLRWEDITAHITENGLGRKLNKREVDRFVKRDIITVQK